MLYSLNKMYRIILIKMREFLYNLLAFVNFCSVCVITICGDLEPYSIIKNT